jgi:hypothetical protein
MKIIKLQSEEILDKSVFTNNLAYPLTVPEYCQIALKNLTLEYDSTSYLIDDTNNTFNFKSADSGTNRTVVLTKGSYKINGLVRELETRLNNALEQGKSEEGFQWKVGTFNRGNDQFLKISFNRADRISVTTTGITPPITTPATAGALNWDGTNSYFYKSSADDAGKFNAHLANNVPACRGGWEIKMTIDNQATAGDLSKTNFLWGLDISRDSINYSLRDEIIAAMWCCIGSDSATGKYRFKKGGVMIAASPEITIQASDQLSIKKVGGKIRYTVTKSGVASFVEGDTINDSLLDFMGTSNNSFVLHVGNDTLAKTAFKALSLNPDPYFKVSSGVYTSEDAADIYLDTNLTSSSVSSIVSITFADSLLQDLLGFISFKQDERKIVSGDVKSSTFYASHALTQGFLPSDSLEIEIMEMSFDNYSQASRQRKNLIMIISLGELQSNTITTGVNRYVLSFFEQANFMWCSLNNPTPLRYSALTLRATCNNRELSVVGKMSATLLYKKESEM